MVLINVKTIAGTLGALLFFLGAVLLIPMGAALWYGEASWWSFGVVALGALLAGGLGWYRYQREGELRVREGFAVVALAWLLLSMIGALPFVIAGVLDQYTDAFFETMSGFTTTGATILGGAHTPMIEAVPNAFLLWRSLTHWLGGMGIIVLTLAILPMLGVGGVQLFKAEVPGPSADKLTPLVKQTAQRLWLIYVGLTFVEVLLLLPSMSLFDAVNHAFATMATGGFSTENGSVGQYGSAYVDWVIIVFMFLAGINFALHYRLLVGRFDAVLRDAEFWTYAGILLVATVGVVGSVFAFRGLSGDVLAYESFPDALRYAAFQVVAIVTTTGFGTADYELWPPLAVSIIFLLFFVGGMAGSTGGGVKVIRHVLLYKSFRRELRRLLHPQAVIAVRVSGKVVSQDVVQNVLTFMVLFTITIVFGMLMLAMLGVDLMTALSASISCVANVGPAFGTVGPAENYAHIPLFGKWVLALLMMVGRLEIFTVFVLFVPDFWQK